MSVLSHLGDEDARPASIIVLERLDEPAGAFDGQRHGSDLPFVDSGNRLDLRAMTAPDLLECSGDLADRRLRARSLHGRSSRRPCRSRRRPTAPRARSAHPPRCVPSAGARASRSAGRARRCCRPSGSRSLPRPPTEAVHADDPLVAGIDPRLRARRRFLDLQLRNAGLDRLRHAAEGFDLLDMAPALREAVRRST